jgi:hypothetical protein
MAKVTGPLMSMSASGKLADALVFFGWKGRNVVRGFVVPANPEDPKQGDNRIIMGGTGRAVGKIQAGKYYADLLVSLGLITAGQTKQSFLVKYIIDHYLTSSLAYGTMLAAFIAHTASGAFNDSADDLTIVEFDLDYANVAAYQKGFGLYLIAKASIDLAMTGTPYTTNITAWVTADVEGMVNDFTSAV